MKQMKRMLALLLALVMIVGVLPLSVFADEYGTATGDFDIKNELVDAAIVFTDLHTSKNDYKQSTVAGIMGALKATGLPFSSVTSGGDAFSVNSDSGKYTGYTSTITGYIRDALGNSTIPVNYAWSDHDRYALQEDDKTLLDKTSHLVYGAGVDGIYGTSDDGNYYVYVLSMADLSTDVRYNAGFSSDREAAIAIEKFKSDAAELLKDRPLLIVSHQPLLDCGDDNGRAYDWALAINEVAEKMDVAFFHGHNHNHSEAGDYYYAKGSTMSVCSDSEGNATPVELNFAHIAAGYMAPQSDDTADSDARTGVAVAVEIYERTVKFVTYDKSGVYTGSNALNETVDRDHGDANVPKSLSVTGKISYTVGETIVDPTEVKVTYMSGDIAAAENYSLTKITKDGVEVTLVDNKFAEAGKYVLTYTCTVGNYQAHAALIVTVAAAPGGDGEEQPEEEIKLPVVAGANVTEIRDVTSGITVENVTNYVAYDIVAEMTGDTAMVSIPVPSDWVVGELNAYYVDENGNITNETFDVSYADGYATFTVTHFSVYALTNTLAETEWIHITTSTGNTYYELATSVESGQTYLIATGYNRSARLLRKDGYRSANVSVTSNRITNGGGTDYEWVFTAADGGFTICDNDNQYLYTDGTYDRGWEPFVTFDGTAANAMTVSFSGNAAHIYRTVTSGNRSEEFYLSYSNGFDVGTRESNLYLFKKVTEPAGSVYAKMEAPVTMNFGLNEGNRAAVEAAIKVWTATNSEGTDQTETRDFTLVCTEGTEDYSVAGTFTVTVRYQGVTLGTITVSITADPFLNITEGGVAKDALVRTNVQVGDTIQLGVIAFNGSENVENPTITWSISEEDKTKASVDTNGLVTVLSNNTSFWVYASWTVNGVVKTDAIKIGVSPDKYLTPNVSTDAFPDYPHEGAIRHHKTATAVGNFSETGIAQVELSMTGVPYTTGSEIDVVLMLDKTASMNDNRISATVAAAKLFVESVVKNADGTYNKNRIYVGYFEGSRTVDITDSGNIGGDLATVDSDTELELLFANIDDDFNNNSFTIGTNYAVSLRKCYERLAAAKTDGTGNNRQQFCVFMSDGVPTCYQYDADSYYGAANSINRASEIYAMFTGSYFDTRDTDYLYEYYSTEMKKAGVTVYTVGLGLNARNDAWGNTYGQAAYCVNASSILLNDISGPADEAFQPDAIGTTTTSKKDHYFFSVEDAVAAAGMKAVFESIAIKIKQAATDVTVVDKVADAYTMIFDIPTGTNTISGVENDFYIEFLKYTLDATTHERTGEATSVIKLYLQNSDNVLSAKNAEEPVFEAKTLGDKGKLLYWTTDAAYADKAAAAYTSGDTTYYFVPAGQKIGQDGTVPAGWYNMTSGAYVYGTVDPETNMSDNVVIANPYFVYNAGTRILCWTVEKLENDTTEYALRYFLYLNRSATEAGTDQEIEAATYPTNEYAHLYYTNYKDNDCHLDFEEPQLTWKGAQVSYVFYLVDAQGQPINKSGQVVNFANAVFITQVFTQSVVWNEDEGVTSLNAVREAEKLLPSDYTLYDSTTAYEIHVYMEENGIDLYDHFIITNGKGTTKVYNTKAGVKYDAAGKYTATDVAFGFDFAHTTVAFAVVWEKKLVEDTVVVDFGLDVLIDVIQNDLAQNTVSGIGLDTSVYGETAMNTGVSTEAKLGTAALTVGGHTVSIENENQIRFHQNSMTFTEAVKFYYESQVAYYEGSEKMIGYMHSSVTVIPATTIYYEDSFISSDDLKTYAWAGTDWGTPTTGISTGDFGWKLDGAAMNNTQAQDRPGPSQISAALDADNNYGYDDAYKNMSQHSMGSALKAHVDYDHMATASFGFWGTGFDVIALTSSTTGTVIVNVYDSSDKQVKSFVVNTYYGFAYDGENWVPTDSANPNALYQVPAMKISELPYGQYRAEIKVVYDPIFDQGLYDDASYDFYLDAIRIYDPTGNLDETSNDAYLADGEAWPEYFELRNMVLDAAEAQSKTELEGVVFIDGANSDPDEEVSVSDYTSYGPNNELYLAKNQSIAFRLNATANNGAVAGIQLGIKSVGGTGHVVITADGKTYIDMDVATATDMYYDLAIKDFNGKTVTITSTGDAIISLTNVKVTYTEAQKSGSADEKAYLLSVNASSILSALLTLKGKEPIMMPNVPAEPGMPEVPELPGKPVRPIKPGKPVQPGKPIQPVQPAQPVQPVLPGKPVQPNKPVMPGKPVRPGSSLAVALY